MPSLLEGKVGITQLPSWADDYPVLPPSLPLFLPSSLPSFLPSYLPIYRPTSTLPPSRKRTPAVQGCGSRYALFRAEGIKRCGRCRIEKSQPKLKGF